jgi:hypothetical protein
MENVGVLYDRLESFAAISDILWPLGIVSGHLAYFSRFWYVLSKRNLAALIESRGQGRERESEVE